VTIAPHSRKPQRVTITISYQVYSELVKESDWQGRSLSNLASFWLEQQALMVKDRH
jgi:predicted CopG family antitoxin